MKNNFLLIAGASGGHILPAISLINKLNLKNQKILFLTDMVGKNFLNKINNQNCICKIIPHKNKIKIILFQFFFSLKFIIKNQSIKVIGFGGFITLLPIILIKLSNIFNKKNIVYIHEQNIIYGLANKFIYFFSNYVFISFPKIKLKSKEIYVGNFFKVINNKINKINEINKINKNNNSIINKILLLGGSAGSIDLNIFLLDFMSKIPFSEISKYEFHIQTPNNNKIKNQLLRKSKNITFFDFQDNINFKDYYLIISRSGSGSLFEILFFTDKVYFEPHIHSRDKHQKHNKLFFINYGYSIENLVNHKGIDEISEIYFNKLINPFSIDKILSFISK